MLKKLVNGIKDRIVEKKKKIMAVTGLGIMYYVVMPQITYAAADFTKPVTNLTGVITTIMQVAGVPTLAWGVFSFARAYQKRDQNGEHQAIDVCIVGGILLGGGTVLGLLTA